MRIQSRLTYSYLLQGLVISEERNEEYDTKFGYCNFATSWVGSQGDEIVEYNKTELYICSVTNRCESREQDIWLEICLGN